MTTTDLTNRIMEAVSAKYFTIGTDGEPQARVICWRRNVGAALGLGLVKRAVAALAVGDVPAAKALLRQRPVTFGLPGEPDIDGVVNVAGFPGAVGIRLAIEVKNDGDRLRPEQRDFRDMIERMGGIYIEARSVEGALLELERRICEKQALCR